MVCERMKILRFVNRVRDDILKVMIWEVKVDVKVKVKVKVKVVREC
jgi:hypothetical protein